MPPAPGLLEVRKVTVRTTSPGGLTPGPFVLYLFRYGVYVAATPGSPVMSQPAQSQPALAAPSAAAAFEDEVQEALSLCGGDPMKALRITLIANAFLEARISTTCRPPCRVTSPAERNPGSLLKPQAGSKRGGLRQYKAAARCTSGGHSPANRRQIKDQTASLAAFTGRALTIFRAALP